MKRESHQESKEELLKSFRNLKTPESILGSKTKIYQGYNLGSGGFGNQEDPTEFLLRALPDILPEPKENHHLSTVEVNDVTNNDSLLALAITESNKLSDIKNASNQFSIGTDVDDFCFSLKRFGDDQNKDFELDDIIVNLGGSNVKQYSLASFLVQTQIIDGAGHESGHYKAYIRDGNNHYFEYDDKHKKPIDKEAFETASRKAYVARYIDEAKAKELLPTTTINPVGLGGNDIAANLCWYNSALVFLGNFPAKYFSQPQGNRNPEFATNLKAITPEIDKQINNSLDKFARTLSESKKSSQPPSPKSSKGEEVQYISYSSEDEYIRKYNSLRTQNSFAKKYSESGKNISGEGLSFSYIESKSSGKKYLVVEWGNAKNFKDIYSMIDITDLDGGQVQEIVKNLEDKFKSQDVGLNKEEKLALQSQILKKKDFVLLKSYRDDKYLDKGFKTLLETASPNLKEGKKSLKRGDITIHSIVIDKNANGSSDDDQVDEAKVEFFADKCLIKIDENGKIEPNVFYYQDVRIEIRDGKISSSLTESVKADLIEAGIIEDGIVSNALASLKNIVNSKPENKLTEDFLNKYKNTHIKVITVSGDKKEVNLLYRGQVAQIKSEKGQVNSIVIDKQNISEETIGGNFFDDKCFVQINSKRVFVEPNVFYIKGDNDEKHKIEMEKDSIDLFNKMIVKKGTSDLLLNILRGKGIVVPKDSTNSGFELSKEFLRAYESLRVVAIDGNEKTTHLLRNGKLEAQKSEQLGNNQIVRDIKPRSDESFLLSLNQKAALLEEILRKRDLSFFNDEEKYANKGFAAIANMASPILIPPARSSYNCVGDFHSIVIDKTVGEDDLVNKKDYDIPFGRSSDKFKGKCVIKVNSEGKIESNSFHFKLVSKENNQIQDVKIEIKDGEMIYKNIDKYLEECRSNNDTITPDEMQKQKLRNEYASWEKSLKDQLFELGVTSKRSGVSLSDEFLKEYKSTSIKVITVDNEGQDNKKIGCEILYRGNVAKIDNIKEKIIEEKNPVLEVTNATAKKMFPEERKER